MAIHKSALKRARQSAKQRLRNRALKSAYRTEIRKFITTVNENKLEDAKKLLPAVHQIIDKSHTKGVIPKNTASRYKSNLATMLNKAAAQT